MRGETAGRRALARLGTLAAVVALALTATACGGGGSGSGGADAPRPRSWDWPQANADLKNTRRVGGPIDASTVSKLQVAWTIPAGATASNAIVVGGVVYTQDLNSNVSAIDLASGRVLWRQEYGEQDIGPNGVTVGDGRVYGATESIAFALDAKTGKQLWTQELPQNDHEGIDMAPAYRDGTVYISTVPTNLTAFYGPGGRGILWALDAASGRARWKWAQVPASLWGSKHLNGGGGLWHPPGFDDDGGMYIDIGNPSPFPGVEGYPWGASRPGPNRWTNSLVKLSVRTGRLIWGRQAIPHDFFDWDLECPPILTRANGRSIVLAGGKMGFVYAFDTASGRLVWKRSVGIHNGHDHDSRIAMEGHGDRLGRRMRVLPGQLGGIETPMAIDGDSIYVAVENLYSTYDAIEGAESGPLRQGRGELVALDLATGRVKWDHKLPHSAFSAATVVNDLVFTATYDGTLSALRTDTGRVAWSTRLPAGTNAPLAISGDMLIAAAGVPQDQSQRSALVAYRLKR